MSFTLFLNEGLIKLPTKISEKMIKYFVYWYLAYVEGVAESNKDFDEDDLDMVKVCIARLAKKHNVNPPTAGDIQKTLKTRAIFKNFEMEDLPQSYVERIGKVKGQEAVEELKKHRVKFMVAFRKHPDLDMDEDRPQGIFRPVENGDDQIIISVANMPTEVDGVVNLLSQFKTEEANRVINHTIGIIEHELTHAVQSMILYQLHPDQFDNNGKAVRGLRKDQAKKEKYHTSQVEFDPQIKGAIREINNVFAQLKAKTKEEKREIFNRYTFSDADQKNVSRKDKDKHYRSPFFKSLRRSDPDKWKKAVKLLAKEVLE